MAYSLFSPRLGINTVPDFVSSPTAKGLRKAMSRNNAKQKGFVMYHDIQWNPKDNKWYAWFYVTEDIEGLSKLLGGDVNGR